MKGRRKMEQVGGAGVNGGREQAISACALRLWRGSGKRISLPVATDSMLPMIRPGDVVSVRMVHSGCLKSGDIIAYLDGHQVMIHRFIGMKRKGETLKLWQQGDALPGWGCFDEDTFLGMAEAIHRGRALLQMDRMPWLLVNRMLGMEGLMRMQAVHAARCVKRRTVGNRPTPFLNKLAGGDPFLSGIVKRMVIRAGLCFRPGFSTIPAGDQSGAENKSAHVR